MKKQKIQIDRFYLVKKLDKEYMDAFYRVYDALLDSNKDVREINIIANIALQQCLDGMKDNKKASIVIPKQTKDYISKYAKGSVYKDMKRTLRNQDYEKFSIASIWMVFTVCIVLFFLKNLMMQEFLVNYAVDVAVACIAGAFAFQNFMIRRRIVARYRFGSFYTRMDVMTLVACIFVKVISPSNVDITYLLLVISFFVVKRKIKPQFEEII